MQKWWGWGDPNFSFPMDDKPGFWPWIKGQLGINDSKPSSPIRRDAVSLPPPTLNIDFLEALRAELNSQQILESEEERLLHAYGKSLPDLIRVRQGIVRRPPDMVVLPRSHDDVVAIIRLANEHNVCVIPFGGGTNIVGCVEPTDDQNRAVVSLDLREMNRLLAIDKVSNLATIEAGALGPKLEEDLEGHGYSLGHFPDSFQYSTIGGWIATRSAGMQSDAYGRIEDMVVSLRVVTPAGEILTPMVPAHSAGPDINQLIIGSEGILGVITEATVQVHRVPAVKDYQGFLFKTFEDGVHAIHECYQQDAIPSMFRVQDCAETELAFKMKPHTTGVKAWIQKGLKKLIQAKGYRHPAMLIVGFEGKEDWVEFTRDKVFQILKKWNGFRIGKSVGASWSQHKFNIPYLRDYLLDFSIFSDVAETSTLWKNIIPLHDKTVAAFKEKFENDPMSKGWMGCHLSHSYPTGACLYFTYAGVQEPGRELEQYYRAKKTITDTFAQNGATLSHHHAVGTEHLPWLEKEISPAGVKAFKGMKQAVDPKSIMNPGKLIPSKPHQYMQADEISEEEISKDHPPVSSTLRAS